MFGSLDPAAVRCPNHDGATQAAAGPVSQAAGMVHDLVDRGINEAHELVFDHGPEALGAETDRQTGKKRFRQRRIHDPLLTESFEKAVRRSKDAAVDADILAKDQNRFVFFHGTCEGETNRLDKRDLAHGSWASANASRCAASALGRLA